MAIWGKAALFVGGMIASTVGVKLITSKTAKTVYSHTAAAAMRCKDSVMEGVTKVREGCGDIIADAKEINEEKAAKAEAEEIIEDCAVIGGEAEEENGDSENV